MNLHSIINMSSLRTAGLEEPYNVPLTGDEIPKFISWKLLTPTHITLIRNYMKTPSNVTALTSLDERLFNTRLGMAKVNSSGRENTGHANQRDLVDCLVRNTIWNAATKPTSVLSDSMFMHVLFNIMRSTHGIGPDTISDFVIEIIRNDLERYTVDVMNHVNSRYVVPSKTTITYNHLNILCMPKDILDDGYYRKVPKDLSLDEAIWEARASNEIELAVNRATGLKLNTMIGSISQLTRLKNIVNKKIGDGKLTLNDVKDDLGILSDTRSVLWDICDFDTYTQRQINKRVSL